MGVSDPSPHIPQTPTIADATDLSVTDLVVAGQSGIGYYESTRLDCLAISQPLLPEISFKQVVCSEVYEAPTSHISMFALSTHNELYFIEGTRTTQNKIIFKAPSGIPIRQGVAVMSVQYNKQSNASELLYVTDKNFNGLRHLRRDPVTTLWTENGIEIKVLPGDYSSLPKTPVYMSTVSLTNNEGLPVPQGYSVLLTCEPHMHVSCNGRSFTLDNRPTRIQTSNASGQIDFTLPVDPFMGSCVVTVELFEFGAQSSHANRVAFDPAKRVVDIFSSIKSETDLRNARGPEGEVIFQDEAKITQCGALLTQFGSIAETLTDTPTKSAPSSENIKERGTTWSWSTEDDSVHLDPDTSWFDKASISLGQFLGDAIEYLRITVKTAVKFAVKTVGKIVMFGLRIAGKVFSFVLKGVVVLVKAVCGILNNLFGIDTSKLTKWLALAFSTENAKKTQKVRITDLPLTIRYLKLSR